MTLPVDRLDVDGLRRHLPAILIRRTPRPPTVITQAGAPAALLLPYATARHIAARRGLEISLQLSAAAGRDCLGDLVYRAARLGEPTTITARSVPRVAVVPIDWTVDLPEPTEGRADR